MKWFVPASAPVNDHPTTCAGCGGALQALVEQALQATDGDAAPPRRQPPPAA
jgi:hypothetical protein